MKFNLAQFVAFCLSWWPSTP